MDDLYKSRSHGAKTFIDHVLCQEHGGSHCRPRQRKVIGGGNTNLKAEKSLSANLGVFVEPSDKITLGVDAWYLNLEHQVGMNFEDMTLAEHHFGPQYIESFDIHVERDSSTQQIQKVIAPQQNLSEMDTSGADFLLEISRDTRAGASLFASALSLVL